MRIKALNVQRVNVYVYCTKNVKQLLTAVLRGYRIPQEALGSLRVETVPYLSVCHSSIHSFVVSGALPPLQQSTLETNGWRKEVSNGKLVRGSLKVSWLSAAPLFDQDGQLSASGRWECYSSPRTTPVLRRHFTYSWTPYSVLLHFAKRSGCRTRKQETAVPSPPSEGTGSCPWGGT